MCMREEGPAYLSVPSFAYGKDDIQAEIALQFCYNAN